MRHHPLTRAAAGLAVVVALSGCQGGDVANTPAPSISPILPTAVTTTPTPDEPSATPSVMPTSSSPLITSRPTTSADLETLAAEAEQLYIEYKTLRLKYEAEGGIDGPLPEDLKKYVAGFESQSAEAVLKDAHQAGSHLELTENLRFVRLGTFMDNLEPESLIGLRMCDDGSKVVHVSADGTRRPAAILRHWSEFARGPEGTLQVIYSEVERVSSCDA
ncbi:hypothetical protein [Aestuariimicrobium sp. Y1814]|uniref:hypothetical protein n=1 Tax=Aestuariimicrobium sp. Y1814 TaxID=3418742 RepID=UPI003DA741E6